MRRRLGILLLATSLIFIATTLLAQSNTTWTTTDGIWNDSSNWSDGIPISDFNAIIPVTAGNITQDLPDLVIFGMELAGEFSNLVLAEQITVAGAFTWNDSTISGNEDINVLGHGTVQNGQLDTTLNNFGSITVFQGTVFSSTGNGTWNNWPGSITEIAESAVFGSSANQLGTFFNADGATVLQSADAASYMIWNVANDGLIQIKDNSQLLFVNDYVQSQTGTLQLMGANSIADMFGLSQIEGRIEGEGDIISTIELEGVISPGQPNAVDPFGSLNVFGSLIMMPDSILEFDIGSNFDSLTVTHNLILDGTVNLTAHEGLSPGTYTVMTANQQLVSGGLKLGALPTGVDASLVIDEINGQVNIVVVSVETRVDVAPDSYQLTSGTYVSGGIADLASSDDARLTLRRATPEGTEFEVKSVSPVANPSTLGVTLEGSVFARFPITQTIELYDYDDKAWEVVDSRTASQAGDATVELEATGDLSRFVEAGSRCIEARIHYKSNIARQRFTSYTDQFTWTISE